MAKNILVTGASGTVGKAVAARLVGHAPVRLATRDANEAMPRSAPGQPEHVNFDFLRPDTFAAALRDVNRVFLLRPPDLTRAKHDFGPFVAAMVEARIERVVFLSVRGAGSNPLLPHRRIERLLERSGLAWTHLRPNDFMQNFSTVHLADIRDRGAIWAPAGRGRTSFVDVRDVAEAATRVLTAPGHERQAYTLTGPCALRLDEVAAILSDVLGKRIIYRNPSILALLRHLRTTDRSLGLELVMTAVYSLARFGFSAALSPDLGRLIGRAPTPFRVFVEDYAAVWKREGGTDAGTAVLSPTRLR